jgi:hypothetical protein
MKKLTVLALLLALLVPGAAFAGASTDAALGLGAFAVFNQIIAGTGIFGVLQPAPRPVFLPAPPLPVAPPVIVREYRPIYVQPPVYYAPLVHRVYHAPERVVVIKERMVPPGHAWRGRPSHGRNW